MNAEATAAATDLALASLATVGICVARAPLWRPLFALLAAVALLGAAAHGLPLGARAEWWLWLPLNFGLGASMALLLAAAGWRHALPLLLLVGFAVGAAAQAFPASFLPIILAEAAALICAGASWWRRRRFLLAAGCAVALAAGAVQATDWRLHLIWEFDHNGLFHLAQIPAMLLWIAGARRSDPS